MDKLICYKGSDAGVVFHLPAVEVVAIPLAEAGTPASVSNPGQFPAIMPNLDMPMAGGS